jgi:hypothetical protein
MSQIRHPYNKHARILMRDAKLKKIAEETGQRHETRKMRLESAYRVEAGQKDAGCRFDQTDEESQSTKKTYYKRVYKTSNWKYAKNHSNRLIRREKTEIWRKGNTHQKIFDVFYYYI